MKTRLSTEWIPRTVRSHRSAELAHEVARERISDDEIVVLYQGIKTGMQFKRQYHESDFAVPANVLDDVAAETELLRSHHNMIGL
jgi:hypothetical protein